eukprot:m.834327 g.834327  ORF g.834327 m.834327 type:complete len:385 (+) comp23446_c0_seq4:168-1322(+)
MAEGIGFTDAQLKRMLAEGGDDDKAEGDTAEIAKQKRAERQRLAAARERKRKLAARKAKEEKLKAAEREKAQEEPHLIIDEDVSTRPDATQQQGSVPASKNPWPPQPNSDVVASTPATPTVPIVPPKEAVELSQEDVSKNELDQLNRIVKQKQLIEEMNKKKKTLLADALRARRAKTQAESQALRRIEAELGQIDTFLSHDIAILREKIEEVNREHVKARKRYEEAETEFVAAKMDLHRTTDTKEKLTEHLVLIIQENEARKSRKLEELMTKMSLSEEDAIKAAEKRMEMEQEAFIREQTRLKLLQEEQKLREQQQAEQSAVASAKEVVEATPSTKGAVSDPPVSEAGPPDDVAAPAVAATQAEESTASAPDVSDASAAAVEVS